MPDGQPLATLTGSQPIFIPNKKILATHEGGKIRLWQMPNGQHLATLGEDIGFYVEDMNLSPDGQILASYDGVGTIRLWQMPNGQHLATFGERDDSLSYNCSTENRMLFSPDGQILACFSNDNKTIRLYLVKLGRLPIRKLCQQHGEWVQKTLQDNEITEQERHWLEFMQALMNWHQRFDVEVEDAPQLVRTGEFDIEIDG